jgi:hypothetical protein
MDDGAIELAAVALIVPEPIFDVGEQKVYP